jgi:hypothetical protein
VISPGWFCLAAMIVAYGVANMLQSVAATRTTVHTTFHPGLLVRLAGQRTYVFGLLCQLLGFVLAVLARRDLPLFLVQASVAAGLGVTALLGVLVPKWSLPSAEIGLLALLLGGITALVLSAQPAHSRPLGPAVVLVLAASVVDAAGAIPAAIVGLLLLGDRIHPGREWLAALGFLVTLGAVLALTRFAEPQHHHATATGGRHEARSPERCALHPVQTAR